MIHDHHGCAGLMSGIVVDSGAAITHIVPVTDGIADQCHTRRLQLAGDHVTDRLRHLLAKRGYALPAGLHGGVAAMKERCCYVAVGYARELTVRRCASVVAAVLAYAPLRHREDTIHC
jgi:Actin